MNFVCRPLTGTSRIRDQQAFSQVKGKNKTQRTDWMFL